MIKMTPNWQIASRLIGTTQKLQVARKGILWASLSAVTLVTNYVPCRDLEAVPKTLLQEIFVLVEYQPSKPGWLPHLPKWILSPCK